jgi:hypothetical protein
MADRRPPPVAQEFEQVQAENTERPVSKLRALMRPDALTRVAPDLEAPMEAEASE